MSGGGYNYGDYARLTGNIAFSGLTNNAGTTTWNNKGAAAIDGADLSAININIDGTIGGCFTTANGWAVQDGMLPGFGAPLELPDHLSLLVNAQVPTITTQPASAAVKTGTTRNLTVTASVTGGTLTYQWYTNTTAANTGGTAISGATSATYAAPIDAAGTFHYYVVITNTIGNNGDGGRKVISVASSVATLVVTAVVNAQIPTITKQPENATARVGTPHSFTVAASAADNGTLGYQWYSNTTASSAGGAAITGATGPVYTVSSGSTGTFYYYAVVTNTITNNGDGGNKTAAVASSAARLTVTSPVIAQTPAIIRQPASAVVKVGAAGATYSLTVAATAADGGVLSYQWYSNTTAGNVGGTAIYGAAAATYTASIHVIGTFHYYVVVTNTIADNGDGGQKTASVASSPATLTVSVDGIGVLSQERIIPGAGARDGAEAAAAAPPGILAGGITAGPNPAGRESGKAVNFYREGGLVKDGTLVVYDASGNFIKRIVIRDKAVVGSAKRAVASWDMRDSRSCPVGAGAYLVKGTVSALGGKKEKVAITVGIW